MVNLTHILDQWVMLVSDYYKYMPLIILFILLALVVWAVNEKGL